MTNYFEDLKIRIVLQHILYDTNKRPFAVECESIEFISYGHIRVKTSLGKDMDLMAPVLFWFEEGEEVEFIYPDDLPAEQNYIDHTYVDFNGPRGKRMLAELNKLYPEGFISPWNPQKIQAHFNELIKLYRDNASANHDYIVAGIEQLVAMICNNEREGQLLEKDQYGMRRLASTLRMAPFDEYDFHSMAKKLNMSMDHFRRLFRQFNGMPPHKYMLQQRMLRAAELLANTPLRIKEIMYSCNFDSEIDFSRTFKKYMGLSPKAYREMNRKTT